MNRTFLAALVVLGGSAALAAPAHAQHANMSFFVTSAGPGKGADLGGLAGADAHCAQLAYAAGFGDLTGVEEPQDEGDDMAEVRDNLDPLAALGSSSWIEDDGSLRGLLRISTD